MPIIDHIFPDFPVFLKADPSNHKIKLITLGVGSHFAHIGIKLSFSSFSFSINTNIVFFIFFR